MQHQTRIVIENVQPQINSGSYFIKRVVGQSINVTANIFSDGHDTIACVVQYKHESDKVW